MKSPFWKLAICSLGIALAAPAMSSVTVIGFDGLTPGFSLPGETVVSSNGYDVKMTFGIGVVDTAAAFGPGAGLDLALPVGTSGQFLTALNDGAFTITRSAKPFQLLGFQAGFVSPLTKLFAPGEYAGSMGVFYEETNGQQNAIAVFDAVANANGEFEMQTVSNVPDLMRDIVFASLFFYTPDGSGLIVWPNQNFNQFVIDNIAVVPVPATLPLVLLAVGLMGTLRARRSV